jgi:5-methylcytosine-specific restriction enzyme subunit McrC
MLEVTELRSGLLVRSFSYVGRVRLGDLEVTVVPKLDQSSLLNLLRYAYGFRKLKRLPEVSQSLGQSAFLDLLVYQLVLEVQEVHSRGLHRTYVRRGDWLTAPRGRIDTRRLAAEGGVMTAALPCIHYPRSVDTPLNRVLHAGLDLGRRVAGDLQLRRTATRLMAVLGEVVTPTPLTPAVLDRAGMALSRLTAAYGPAVNLTRLLYESQGVVLGDSGESVRLPGFLFDMNGFFQAILSRFLGDYLPEFAVHDEKRLRGVFQYAPGFNPANRRPPVPRPDFVVFRQGRPVALLDAKYRDLWERSLPRDMLYQLAIYATSHEIREATILYPTTTGGAAEARIEVRDPVYGKQIARVNLRPVSLARLEGLVTAGHTAAGQRAGREFAEGLVLGR